jgi:hypothetical protein
MKAVRGSKKKIRNRNLTTSSSSSAKAERSRPSKDVLELGRHLVEELGHADHGTTLGRWMAHHLAGLIREADDASTAQKRNAARKKAEQLILQLWEQRASLPGHADPMTRYKSALTTLELLSSNAAPWQHNSAVKLHSLVADLHESVRKLISGIVLSQVAPELPRKEYEDLAVSFLSDIEQRIHQLLGRLSIVLQEEDTELLPTVETSTEERVRASIKSLTSKAARTLEKIAQELTGKTDASDNSGQNPNLEE